MLADTNPLVWRRLLVPETYSFWDLHVAIQDAMGWTDCHLHEFVVVDAKTLRGKRIGIPDEEFAGERPTLAGWEVPIARHLTHGSQPVRYLYDFGDDWNHTLEVEDILPADGGSYPRCVAGAGACPPEDVGGTHGYAGIPARHPRSAPSRARGDADMGRWPLRSAGVRSEPSPFRRSVRPMGVRVRAAPYLLGMIDGRQGEHRIGKQGTG